MRERPPFHLIVIAALGLLALPPIAESQSLAGRIDGTVRDQTLQALPGVQVQLASGALQGGSTRVSDGQGRYRFDALPPGSYTLTLSRSGYHTSQLPIVSLAPGESVSLDSALSVTFDQSVTVQSDTPTSITRVTSTGLSLSSGLLGSIPTGRDYLALASLAPGVYVDAAGPVMQGSSGAENLYYIDGMNTTGAEFGTQGKRLNYEFIQDFQVVTGSASAEQGFSTGGAINLITKAGGNLLSGSAFGYYFGDGMQAGLASAPAKGAVSGASQLVRFKDRDVGGSVGGAIQKDKLWFFAAYDRISHSDVNASLKDFQSVGGPPAGREYVNTTERDLFAAKLTYRWTPQHSAFVSVVGDPASSSGVVDSLAGPPQHFLGNITSGGVDTAIHYDGVIGKSLLVSAGYGEHREKQKRTGDGASIPGYVDNSDPLGDGTVVWGWTVPGSAPLVSGFGPMKNSDFVRRQMNVSLKHYWDSGRWGRHELMSGLVVERTHIDIERSYSGGGDLVSRFACTPSHFCGDANEFPYYYRHRFYISSAKAPADIAPADVLDQLDLRVPSDSTALFAQDVWRMSERLTVSGGLRWERQRLFNASGRVHLPLGGPPAPRVGFRVALGPQREYMVSGSWSRYFERVPLDIVIRSFGGEITRFAFNFSSTPGNVACPSQPPQECFGFGGAFSPVAPNVKNQELDEWVLGVDHDLIQGLKGSARFISRTQNSIIEDALIPSGDYLIGNPGLGPLASTLDIGFFSGLNATVHRQVQPARQYRALQLGLTAQVSADVQFAGSVSFATLRGNYDGIYQVSTGQLDPNLNTAYDFFDFQVNSDGDLSNDRRVDAKAFGSYRTPIGLDVGMRWFYRSGTPVTAMGYAEVLQRWEYFLSRRDEFGRIAGETGVDLHLGVRLPIRRLASTLFADFFNVLNRQTELSRDLKYDLTEAYRVIDWTTSQPLPPITRSDSGRPATNPAFNTSNGWQQPLAVRLGMRVAF